MRKEYYKVKTQYPNLNYEIYKSGKTKYEIAEYIGISEQSFGNKTRGIHEFKSGEMFMIQEYFREVVKKDLSLEYLFNWEEKQN